MQSTPDTAAAQQQPLAWLQDMFSRSAAACERQEQRIRHGDTWIVDQPLGKAVICTEGSLWITHDHEPADHIVEQGGRYAVGHRSRMLVHAMSDSKVQIVSV
jgi:hypothetical protein